MVSNYDRRLSGLLPAPALCGVIKVVSFKKAIRLCAYDIIMFAGVQLSSRDFLQSGCNGCH